MEDLKVEEDCLEEEVEWYEWEVGTRGSYGQIVNVTHMRTCHSEAHHFVTLTYAS